MKLVPFWFIVIAVLWMGFFVLEGFDFGVGMLHGAVGKDEAGRRAAINTIGPLWDGNEVWLIVAGAAMFAAFPGWYATMFSGLYLALVLLLVALIIRGVSFEYRGKRAAERWRRTWDVLMTAGSLLAPLLIGVALGDLLHGLPINAHQEYTGSFFDLLQPYALLTGVTIASYSAVDTVGVRGTTPWIYAGLIWASCTVFLWSYVWVYRRIGWARAAVTFSSEPDGFSARGARAAQGEGPDRGRRPSLRHGGRRSRVVCCCGPGNRARPVAHRFQRLRPHRPHNR